MAKVVTRLEDGRELRGFDLQDAQVKSIGDDEIEIIGSTAHKDRDGEVLDPAGWDLKNFKKNPVILPAHDYRQPAIGKAVNIKIEDGKLVFKIKFPPEGDNPLADVYRKLYKGGFMNASSVGFLPLEWKDGDGKGKDPNRTYTKAELLELSLVSVPCNPNALLSAKGVEKAVHAGILNSNDVKTIMQFAKDGGEDADESKEQGDIKPAGNEDAEEEKENANAYEAGATEPEVSETEKIYSVISELKAQIEALEGEVAELKDKSNAKKHYLDMDDGTAEDRPAFRKEALFDLAKGAFSR
jgi:HK97 family phage prohead protease